MECNYTNKLSGGDFILNDLSLSNYEISPDPFDCLVKTYSLANSFSPQESTSEKCIKSQKVFKIFKVKRHSQNLPLKERIEIKKVLAKKREENKRETLGFNQDDKFLELKRKKEIISIRNRMSSQKSRDKKKKQFEDMKLQIDQLKREIITYKNRISLTCHKCQELFTIPENFHSNNLRGFLRIGLVTSMIVVVCIIANCFSLNQFSEKERNLQKKDSPLKIDVPLILTLPDNKNYYSYKLINSNTSTNISNSSNSTKVMISKNKSIMISSKNNNYSSELRLPKEDIKNQKLMLLEQREIFLKKMNNKIKNRKEHTSSFDLKRNFLNIDQKMNYSTCLNDQKLVLSVQSRRNDNSHDNNTAKLNIVENNNSVIPIQDIFLENSLLKNVKSLFCENPVIHGTDVNMFSKLFKKKEDFKEKDENV